MVKMINVEIFQKIPFTNHASVDENRKLTFITKVYQRVEDLLAHQIGLEVQLHLVGLQERQTRQPVHGVGVHVCATLCPMTFQLKPKRAKLYFASKT